jgi:hypothetical protein
MTTPSRTSELRRRRARKEKISLLRKRYAKASSESDRNKIVEKLKRVAPGVNVNEFTKVAAAPQNS